MVLRSPGQLSPLERPPPGDGGAGGEAQGATEHQRGEVRQWRQHGGAGYPASARLGAIDGNTDPARTWRVAGRPRGPTAAVG